MKLMETIQAQLSTTEANITAYLAAVTNAASVAGSVEALGRAVSKLANYRGRERVWVLMESKVEAGADSAKLLRILNDLLIRGADDAWSGRGNDTNRAFFDGIREAVCLMQFEIENTSK